MVELDDTYIGGKRKPGKRGRGATSKVPVMVAVESRPQGCGHVALRKVASVTSSQAQSFLTHSVGGDTLIFSDGFSSYRSLSQGFMLYPLTLGCTQRAVEIFPDVHRVIARLKTWIRGTHSHVSKKHLNRYLSEFSYRFNRRFKQRRVTIFDRLVTACCATEAITYRQLVADLSG
jgi:transposase-like protein